MTHQPRNTKILIIDRDEAMKKLLHLELTYKGYNADVSHVPDVPENTSAYVQNNNLSLIMIGGEAPAIRELGLAIRSKNKDAWLIANVRNISMNDKVKLIDAGFDDYIDLSNVSSDEFILKVKAISRRIEDTSKYNMLEYADLKMNLLSRTVTRSGKQIDLRSKEFDLLKVLMLHSEEILSREFIFDNVWGSSFLGDSNVIEVYIRYLRSKLVKPNLIKTKRGKGYVLISDEAQIQNNNSELDDLN